MFASQRVIELLRLLSDHFDERFADFHELKNDIRIFENPFSIDVSMAPIELQLELIELQCQTFMKDNFQEKDLSTFYEELHAENYPNLRKLGMKMITAFASTYVCEQTFSVLKRAKPCLRSRMTDDHLHSVLRMSVSNFNPNIQLLVSEKQHQISH